MDNESKQPNDSNTELCNRSADEKGEEAKEIKLKKKKEIIEFISVIVLILCIVAITYIAGFKMGLQDGFNQGINIYKNLTCF